MKFNLCHLVDIYVAYGTLYVLYVLFTIVIVQITSHPMSLAVNVNSTMNLSCEATGSGPIRYQWRRVNGEISSYRAEGVNTSTLTISPVRREDEDEYYCVASNGGVDGSLYNDTSRRAMITVYGKLIIAIANVAHSKLSCIAKHFKNEFCKWILRYQKFHACSYNHNC